MKDCFFNVVNVWWWKHNVWWFTNKHSLTYLEGRGSICWSVRLIFQVHMAGRAVQKPKKVNQPCGLSVSVLVHLTVCNFHVSRSALGKVSCDTQDTRWNVASLRVLCYTTDPRFSRATEPFRSSSAQRRINSDFGKRKSVHEKWRTHERRLLSAQNHLHWRNIVWKVLIGREHGVLRFFSFGFLLRILQQHTSWLHI